MIAKLPVPVLESQCKLMGAMDTTPIDDHHDLLLGFTEGRHHLVNILAQLLGIKMGHDFIEASHCARPVLCHTPSYASTTAAVTAFVNRS
jgi:hypothetical protein